MSAAAAADAPTAPATAAAFTPEELRHPDNFLTAEQNALLAAEPGTTAPVLVTGGNGFIASFIVGILLRQGYTVRATVRDPSNAAKTAVRLCESACLCESLCVLKSATWYHGHVGLFWIV